MTSDYGTQERQRMYAAGGVYFISSRILVMDILVERVPVHLISGILVAKVNYGPPKSSILVRSIYHLYLTITMC